MANMYDLKIFKLNRIKFELLFNDALKWLRKSYDGAGLYFTIASPFYLLLSVILHLGRMIFYYIEDSITGLNIKTAYRIDLIRGLALLTGHDSARPISARAAIKLTYYEEGNTELYNKICYIPNKTELICKLNGCTYTILFGASAGKLLLTAGNYVEASIIEGKIKTQYTTATGLPLLSYNFTERNFGEVELYYVNIYVNDELWPLYDSLLDIPYYEKGAIVKTGITSGIDVFFGNGNMGAIPPQGATIRAEYIVSSGAVANIPKEKINTGDMWEINGVGTLSDSTEIDLNSILKVTCTTDIIFGNSSENVTLTLLIAPYASRSMVLANELNYKYFFKKMNMFSDIEIIKGTSNYNSNTTLLLLAYDLAYTNYKTAYDNYNNALATYGENNNNTLSLYNLMKTKLNIYQLASLKLADNEYNDNTIYLYLVPDAAKRISSTLNYFDCDESVFYLSNDEMSNLLNLIDASLQRIITVENKIISPKIAHFAINITARINSSISRTTAYTSCINALSEYFLLFSRTSDIMPISDIITKISLLSGFSSVNAQFIADPDNEQIYGIGDYGINEYGDIKLSRNIIDLSGQNKSIHDILPLIRGGFTDSNNNTYSSELTIDGLSGFNFNVIGTTNNGSLNLDNYEALT